MPGPARIGRVFEAASLDVLMKRAAGGGDRLGRPRGPVRPGAYNAPLRIPSQWVGVRVSGQPIPPGWSCVWAVELAVPKAWRHG